MEVKIKSSAAHRFSCWSSNNLAESAALSPVNTPVRNEPTEVVRYVLIADTETQNICSGCQLYGRKLRQAGSVSLEGWHYQWCRQGDNNRLQIILCLNAVEAVCISQQSWQTAASYAENIWEVKDIARLTGWMLCYQTKQQRVRRLVFL